VVFAAAARSNKPVLLDELRTVYETANFPEIECACVASFGQTTDQALLDRYYNYAFQDAKVRSQDLLVWHFKWFLFQHSE
jgi:hypothetical protein